jgi:hypothetical protein
LGDVAILIAVLGSERSFGRNGNRADYLEAPTDIGNGISECAVMRAGFRYKRFAGQLAKGFRGRTDARAVVVRMSTPPHRPGRLGGNHFGPPWGSFG